MLEYVKRNLIYLISSTDIFAVSLIVPLYSLYLKSINFSNVSVGLLNSLYAGVQFFASPVIGHLSDLYGSRCVLIGSLLICSLCYPIMGLSVSFAAIACVRILIGVVKHTQLLCKSYIEERTAPNASLKKTDINDDDDVRDQTCSQDTANDETIDGSGDSDEHAHSFGRLSAFMSLGYVVGPIIGGYLIDSPNGFTYMCFATGSFFLLNSAFAYSLPAVRLTTSKAESVVSRNFVTSFKNIPWSTCWDLFLLKSLTAFAVFSFYFNYSTSISSRYGVSSVYLGYSLSLQGLVRAITGFTTRSIFDLFPASLGTSNKIRFIYLLIMINLVALYFSLNFYVYLACLVPFNASLCLIRIVNHEALVDRIRSHNKGIILGAFNNVTAVSRFVLPLISGYLADRYGHDSAYFVSGASLLLAACVLNLPKRHHAVRIKTD